MKLSNSIIAAMAVLACSATVFAGYGSGPGTSRQVPSLSRASDNDNAWKKDPRRKKDHDLEGREREKDADAAASSPAASQAPAATPAPSPAPGIGSAPASTVKTVPVSAMGSSVGTAPTSTLTMVPPSALSTTPAPVITAPAAAPTTTAPATAAPAVTPTTAATTPAATTGTAAAATPAANGAALYTSLCVGCHGNAKMNRPVANIQAAISANVGGMGSLSYLTPAQLQAISAY